MPQTITRNQWYTVLDGETMPQISQRAGFRNWLTIYNHEQNYDFRYDNPDPFKLEAGSEIWIPEKRLMHVSCQIGEKHQFIAKSPSQIRLVEKSPTDDISETTGISESFDMRFEVPLISQQESISTWAAGAAMLVAWRDEIAVDISEVQNAVGYWSQHKNALESGPRGFYSAWNMVTEPAREYTVEDFDLLLLKARGPLWVGSAELSSNIRVVTGIVGDGTPERTLVYINDPRNTGTQYFENYNEFVQNQAALSGEANDSRDLFVAYLRFPSN